MPDRTDTLQVEALGPLAGGINDSQFETLLKKGQTPSSVNIEFDDGSVKTARGSIPFNRQSAPRSAIRSKVDPALSKLSFKPGASVPLRGYLCRGYIEERDIGGRFDLEGDPLLGTDTYYNRRGVSFEIGGTFLLPDDEKLYEAETRGSNAPAVGAEAAGFGGYPFDEGQDECFIIRQKGGDKTAPMSWAFGVVNVGRGLGLTDLPATRPSNYAFVFMWLDSVGFGVKDQIRSRYNLTTGQNPNSGAAAQNASQAYRAILIHKYIVPGRRYSYAVQLKMDSGTPGAAASNTAWAQDGAFRVLISESGGTPTQYSAVQTNPTTVTRVGMEVIRGPADSAHYLLKYGIRFAGRDAEHMGLGQRFIPWQTCGFLPFGCDLTPLENAGFQMADRTLNADTIGTWYGAGVHTLTAQHVAGETFLRMNHQGLVIGNTNGGASPWAQGGTGGPGAYTRWEGYGNSVAADIQRSALNGYSVVLPRADGGGTPLPAGARGALLKISDYTEVGGPLYRLEVAAPGAMGNFGPTPALIQCFRWHQRPIEFGEIRTWAQPRDYQVNNPVINARRKLSLRMSLMLGDETEPDLENLIDYMPCDDAEGTVARENLIGGIRDGFMCPSGLGTTLGGIEGDELVFLSGEGEAPCIDLSANPIFQREVEKMLESHTQGFAIELSCVFMEACYAIQDNSIILPDSGTAGLAGSRPQFVPEILSWDVKDPANSGMRSTPKPLITLTHRAAHTSTNTVPFKFPMGFSVEVAHRSDQEDVQPIVPSDLLPFYLDAGGANQTRYGLTAPWVGKNVRIQIGIQSTGTDDQYDVYIAMSPKDAFNPQPGDPSDAEFAYWTAGGGSYSAGGGGITYAGYFTAAHLTIKQKDLARSVITIGRWNPGSLGYCEMQPRMLVGALRFYAASAPGGLPATNGGVLTGRDGKLEGTKCLPSRALEQSDLLQPIGPGLSLANVVQGSTTVTAPATAKFWTNEARTTLNAVKHTYLYVPGDKHAVLAPNTTGSTQEEFYYVSSVATTLATAGNTLTLSNPFADGTRNYASAFSLRMLFYTSFADDIRDTLLTFGAGQAFVPGTTTTADVILTEELWANIAPITGGMRLRYYSPLGRTTLQAITPSWVRGHVFQRHNPILGAHYHSGRMYMGARGALFQLDDRWRQAGPTEKLAKSIAFLPKMVNSRITAGLQNDRVEFTNASAVLATFGASETDAYVTIYDAWVQLNGLHETQTLLWIGDYQTDASLNAGSSGHRVHAIMRFANGRPEFVFGSTAFYTGTTVPEKGLFVATASTPLAVGKRTHIRWYVVTRTNGTVILIPHCKIMGKRVMVTVNARDNDASITNAYDWLRSSTLVAPGTGGRILMGIASDAYRSPDASITFTPNALGTNQMPQRYAGFLHSLDGEVSQAIITRQPVWSGASTNAAPPDFDPFTLDYGATGNIQVRFNALSNAIGVGHKVHDEASDEFGTIISHPFISKYHELGMLDEPISFADFGQNVYATNGGRPARIQPNSSGMAGVLPPTTPLKFRVERLTLWRQNQRPRDPTPVSGPGAALQNNHYSNWGNNYLEQNPAAAGHAEISFTKSSAATADIKVFGFKAFVYFPDTSGRQVLWSKRTGTDSGGVFVECNDGKVVIGWYDQYQKRRVMVETDDCVISPGVWHYINLRKWWPKNDALEGNWENEFYSNGAIRRVIFTTINNGAAFVVGAQVAWTAGGGAAGTGLVTKSYGPLLNGSALEFIVVTGGPPGTTSRYTSPATAWSAGSAADASTSAAPIRPMKDKLVVRRLSPTPAINPTEAHPLEAKCDNATRNCISFTTPIVASALAGSPAGTTATGQVSLPGIQYTGAAGGLVNVNAGYPAVPSVFHNDMLGMYWQWGTVGAGAAAFVGILYKIVAVNSGTQIQVVVAGSGGALPNFAGVTATEGAVFSGIALMKSPGFDTSKMPDDTGTTATYPIHAFGCPESIAPNSGVAPTTAEFASFGWTCAYPAGSFDGTLLIGYEDARVFEQRDSSFATGGANDPIIIGTDILASPMHVNGPNELQFDNWVAARQEGTWACYDGRPYGAAGNQISSQPRPDLKVTADADITQGTNISDLTWKYLQAASVMAGTRYARVRFFDKEQNEVSDPGPAVTILPAPEDAQNPSGNNRYVITDLPAPRQRGEFEVWVYLSLSNGTDVDLFRVAEVPVGTREVAILLPDSAIGAKPPIDFESGSPPRCFFLAAAQSRMAYVKLEDDPVGIVYSKLGFPVSINYGLDFPRASNGFGEALTMAKELDGFLVLGKRRWLGALTVDENDLGAITTISTGVGCIAHQSAVAVSSRLYFLSDSGIESVQRTGVTNLGLPVYVSSNLKTFFNERMDRRYANRVSAALNRLRNQYVMTAREIGERHTNVRISLEFDASIITTPLDNREVAGTRFARYEGPNVTVLCSVPDPLGGADTIIGGTEEGMALWMDRPDSQLLCAGEEAGVWGFSSSVIAGTNAVTTATSLAQAGQVDLALEGARGCPIRYKGQDGVERVVTCIVSDGNYFHHDQVMDQGAPLYSEVTIGGMQHYWEMPWSNFSYPGRSKKGEWVTLECSVEEIGDLIVQVLRNLDRTNVVMSHSVKLDKAEKRFSIGRVEFQHLKLAISTPPLTAGYKFDLTDILIAFRDKERYASG